jgi:hypothetical protein
MLPRARGLALGYMLSPAARACVVPVAFIPRARGLALGYMLSPAARACVVPVSFIPRARGLALGYTLSPAARARAVALLRVTQTDLNAQSLSPVGSGRNAHIRFCVATQVSKDGSFCSGQMCCAVACFRSRGKRLRTPIPAGLLIGNR